MTWPVIIASVIVLLAGVLTGLTGFGFSVLSVPLLLLVLPAQEVVVLALGLVPITSAVLLLTRGLRGRARWRTAAALTAFSFLGLPIGLVLFEHVDPVWVVALMGAVLLSYATYGLRGPVERDVLRHHWLVPSGLLGGVLATSTGLSGPAVAMYVHGRRLGAREQVATMALYVGAVSLLGLVLLTGRGVVGVDDVRTVGLLAPPAVLGTLAGRWWGVRKHAGIDRVVLYALAFMGIWSILRSAITLLVG